MSSKRSNPNIENLPSPKKIKKSRSLKRSNPNTENPSSSKRSRNSLKLQNRLPNIKYASSVVKISLHKLLNEDFLHLPIQTSVEKMSKITYEGSLLANLIVLYLINTNQPIPRLDQTFFRRTLKAVTATNKRQLNVPCDTADSTINFCRDFLYIPCCPAGKEWVDSRFVIYLSIYSFSYFINKWTNIL